MKKESALYDRIREFLESAQTNIARTINSAQVVANWLIGKEILEEEQMGARRASYGSALLRELSIKLTRNFGSGWSFRQLGYCRAFYHAYPGLLKGEILHAVRAKLNKTTWKPGQVHPNLSWTHYRTLLGVENSKARSFYEIEATRNNWSARELERQINSLLFERLAYSKDKTGLLRLAFKGQEIQSPADVFKDPVVIEFLGLPESSQLVETDLEQQKKIFTSRYKLHLPSVAEVTAEIRRELKALKNP